MQTGKTTPTDYNDVIQIARRLLNRFQKSQDIDDLFAAVLATSHIADWYHPDLDARKFGEDFTNRFPEWSCVRKIGNGLKHVAKEQKINVRPLEWEDDGFWLSQSDENTLVWAVAFEGSSVMVSDLCLKFINDFEAKDNL